MTDVSAITILIVEDSPTQRLRLQHVLEKHGHHVTAASDGREALAALAATPPDMVITDINMPEMDGYELCQRIKDTPGLKDIPVILLTSLSDPGDILKGLECGADNFIVKPYEEEFLLARIHFVLRNLDLRSRTRAGEASEVFFSGRTYKLSTERTHSLDLLLSTYETAVHKNLELSRAKETLEHQAVQLREKNEQMSAELELARELQAAFLPRNYPVFPPNSTPEQSAIRFCHRYTTTTELGGDFFDIRALSGSQAGVLVCDVMGHGVRAALVASILRGLAEELRPIASEPAIFLAELNKSLRTILRQTPTSLFATAFYLVADAALGEIRFANAGHPAPFHVRRALDQVEPLVTQGEPGPALGLFAEPVYVEERRPLAPGDMVMIFTDGLYEVEDADGAFYDTGALRGAVARRVSLPTPKLCDELLDEIRRFSATHEFADDMCVVGMDMTRWISPATPERS